jgi:hypothetical protein
MSTDGWSNRRGYLRMGVTPAKAKHRDRQFQHNMRRDVLEDVKLEPFNYAQERHSTRVAMGLEPPVLPLAQPEGFGKLGGLCGRATCKKPGASFWSEKMQRHYCEKCSRLLGGCVRKELE